MRKKLLTLLIAILSLFTFISCTTNKVENTIINNENTSHDTNNQNKDSTPNNIDFIDNDAISIENDYKKFLLSSMSTYAKDGKVIDCNFRAKYNIIDDVINSWGKESESNFVEKAKGTYYTFPNKEEVFGTNKGGEIFEVRSFNKKLNLLTFKDIVNYFGQPTYDILSNSNERIIGYIINDDFKILFVFHNGNIENPYLDHYNVLYPKGTKNLMADDPGREW